jgi:bacteriorhodopsin
MIKLLDFGKKFFSTLLVVASLPTLALAGGHSSGLAGDDYVGVTFWIISMAMVASTVFFIVERDRVSSKWKTSLTVSALVTLIAAVHYFYMRDVWVATGESPTVFRYIDWLLTVPLLMIEFYFILAAVTTVSSGIFWRLLVGTVVMLVGGYMGEAGMISVMTGFIIGMIGWLYILYEIFAGEASKANASSGSAACQTAFGALRLIVTVGWAIYPIGYFVGYLTGGGADAATLNIVYNLADFVNKIAFGLIIWAAAVKESA